jgi:hypothetical protein
VRLLTVCLFLSCTLWPAGPVLPHLAFCCGEVARVVAKAPQLRSLSLSRCAVVGGPITVLVQSVRTQTMAQLCHGRVQSKSPGVPRVSSVHTKTPFYHKPTCRAVLSYPLFSASQVRH